MSRSSRDQPKAVICCTVELPSSPAVSAPKSAGAIWILCLRSHAPYGALAAFADLTSTFLRISPVSRSIVICRPGPRRPFHSTSSSLTSTTPVSLIMASRPSLVSSTRAGRSPLRSSCAPICLPSQKVRSAGPSHASWMPA